MTAAVFSIIPRATRGPNSGISLLRFYPKTYNRLDFIYAIAFDGGVLKVGRTHIPRKRFSQHWRAAHGQVMWLHLFEGMSNNAARIVEAEVPAVLSAIGQRVNKTEWWHADAPKSEVVAVVRPVIAAAKAKAELIEAERAAALRRRPRRMR